MHFAQWAQGLVELSEQRAREERNQGLREGEAKGRAAAILLVLKTRGVTVPPDIEQRITVAAVSPLGVGVEIPRGRRY